MNVINIKQLLLHQCHQEFISRRFLFKFISSTNSINDNNVLSACILWHLENVKLDFDNWEAQHLKKLQLIRGWGSGIKCSKYDWSNYDY